MKLSNVLREFTQLNKGQISSSTLAVFLHIGETDRELCQVDIVNHFGLAKASVCRIINCLSCVETKDGQEIRLVERRSPRSGRARNILVLTDKGQEIFDQIYSDLN